MQQLRARLPHIALATVLYVHLGGAPKVRSLRRHHAVTKQRRFKVYGQTPRGLYRLIVCADSREALAEQNEANNCHTAADDLLVPKLSPPILPPPPR